MEIQNVLNRYRMIAVGLVTLSTTAYFSPSYAIWYPCPAPSAVVAGNYAPFTVCKGNTSNAQRLMTLTLNEIDPLPLMKIDPPDSLEFSKMVNQGWYSAG